MKNLLNLKDVKSLGRTQQKTIFGGGLIEFGDPAGGSGGGRCDGNNPPCTGGEICCGPPGGAQYCQPCPCEYSTC